MVGLLDLLLSFALFALLVVLFHLLSSFMISLALLNVWLVFLNKLENAKRTIMDKACYKTEASKSSSSQQDMPSPEIGDASETQQSMRILKMYGK